MSQNWPEHPEAPLVAIGAALGVLRATWAASEEAAELLYGDDQVDRARAASLGLDLIEQLADRYGPALECRFLLGALPVLDIRSGLTESDLDDFRAQTAGSPTVRLDVRLDKRRLGDQWAGARPHCRVIPYLFPEAAERLLQDRLDRLEHQLWEGQPARKVVLLVPGRDLRLDGPYLAVVGGRWLAEWEEVAPREPPDSRRVMEMYEACRRRVKWERAWLAQLTPLHLKLTDLKVSDDPIVRALRVHGANVAILYTADRTAEQPPGRWLATYESSKGSAEVALGEPARPLAASPAALIDVAEWAYAPERPADRLPIVQLTVLQYVQAEDDPEARFDLLVGRGERILADLQWNWKSFLDGKLDGYWSQVREAEKYVDDTVQAYADQIGVLIKSLSDAVLAAIAALIGSFVVALFRDKFNASLFTLGMMAYAAYVLLFPCALGLAHTWQRGKGLDRDFAARHRRFLERLNPRTVEEVVGERVRDSRRRFIAWFLAALVIYLGLTGLAVAIAWFLPAWLVDAGLIATPTPAPSAPVLSTLTPPATLPTPTLPSPAGAPPPTPPLGTAQP